MALRPSGCEVRTDQRRAGTDRVKTTRTVLIAHPSAELYGSDRVMLETVSAAVEAGWVAVVALPSDGPLVAAVRERGGEARIVPNPVLRKSSLRPLGLLRLIREAFSAAVRVDRLLRSTRPDVVYVSTLTIPLWLASSRLRRIPVLCHVHEAESSVPYPVRVALAAPLLLADRIVVNSQFSLRVLTGAISHLEGRSAVVYNGVAGPETRVEPRLSIQDGLRVVYIGRLSPRKGVQVAIDAVAELISRGHPVHLAIVGDVFSGYEWFALELHHQVERLGIADRVAFHGFQDAVWPALAQADVAVVPSIAPEPFGNTAIEAVLAARPVVVSACGGLREAVAGFSSATEVAVDDPHSLADALQLIGTDWPRLREAAQLDATLAAERHSLQRYRDSIAAAIRAMLPATGKPAARPDMATS
jgi:glycosyltransferase involved in cell wall biosynthesis